MAEPSTRALTDQLRQELVISGRHLRAILTRYWDHDWRREHYDEPPEGHLWRAALPLTSEMQDAPDALTS